MAVAKSKAFFNKVAARTLEALWEAIAQAIDLFTSAACANDFAAAGYDRD
ncbi:MAG: hypothetical protein ACFB3T_14400 [Geminicoccaceae bacterium]